MTISLAPRANVAIILAAGNGARFGGKTLKQFMPLAGKPVIEYCVETFVAHPKIDGLVIVCSPDYVEESKKICSKYTSRKQIAVVTGGDSRQSSTLAALSWVKVNCAYNSTNVILHDAVRPFVTREIISNVISELEQHEAVDVAIPTADTIIRTTKEGDWLTDIPKRKFLRRGQTPQGFRFSAIYAAYEALHNAELHNFTDDCGVLLAHNENFRIRLVEGSESNIKITNPTDLFVAEQLLFSGLGGVKEACPKKIDKELVAVVFGDSSGIGLACSNYLRAAGCIVEGASKSKSVDIRDARQVSEFLEKVNFKHKRIDIVFNSAGILHPGPLQELELAQVEEQISTNLLGSVIVAQAAKPYLTKTSGQMILVSSSSFTRGRADAAVYSATKAAIANLTQALAEEWAKDAVRVNCLVPRRTNTPMRRKAFPKDLVSDLAPVEDVAKVFGQLIESDLTGVIKNAY